MYQQYQYTYTPKKHKTLLGLYINVLVNTYIMMS